MSANLKKIRPLGYNETYQLARYTLNQKWGTSVTCRYQIPESFTGQDSNTKLANALHSAITRVVSGAPLLQVGCIGENTANPFWIQLDSVDLSEHVVWVNLDSDQAMHATIASHINMRFPDVDKRPGFRVVVMQRVGHSFLDILVVFNHHHGDGMGAKIFHRFLLLELNKPMSEDDQQSLTITFEDSSKDFPPPTEKAGDLTLSPGFLVREAWKEYKPGASSVTRPTDAKWAPIRSEPHLSKFRVVTIPQNVLSNTLSACRDHKTTLTALLNCLALISLASQIGEDLAPGFASSTAIDQRRFISPHSKRYPQLDPKETIANYVTVIYHEFGVDLVSDIRFKLDASAAEGGLSEEIVDLLWKTSARVRTEISNRLEMGLRNDMVGLMKLVPDWRKRHMKDMEKPRALSWFLTNLGLFEELPASLSSESYDPKSNWAIRRAQFTASAEVPLSALLLAVASVRNGDLVITCSWQDTVVETSLVERLVGDMERWLRQIGK
ncbi:hypothetical protein K491DRAFT_719472 [Lophiostoma macrostomum CBS 122681]|uniref:Alcohol acetyltransferase n=1 Tax=Lophiostoma macrostomum CBS 122681 TaxID=1314788 RepID=A0A6A6SXU6_9PLEO|nr:hypothetical protein K491DRAFT_719472 [Lophiostoma macrostomum CBS 122681]